MKKKLLISLFIFFGLFMLVGCSNKKENNNNNSNQNKEEKKYTVKVGDFDVELGTISTFNGMEFRYVKDATTATLGTYTIMDLMNDESDLAVRVAVTYYSGKKLADVINEANLTKIASEMYNSSTWDVYKGEQTDGKKLKVYFTEKENDIYSITFVSNYNLDDFITLFMNNVSFK